MSQFLIASLKNTDRHHEHIVWWRPFHRGYTAVVERAGRYCYGEALSLNDGLDFIAVPVHAIEPLVSPTPYWRPGAKFYDYEGPVVDNTKALWGRLIASSLAFGRHVQTVRPSPFRGKRRSFAWSPEA